MAQRTQTFVGNNKTNWPAELTNAVVEFVDDRASDKKHVQSLQQHAARMESCCETLEALVEEMRERRMDLEESLRIERIVKEAAMQANEHLHKKVRELSRQLAGSRAAKTKLKKRLA